MTILVTGGTGFVGSNLVRALAETGHEILCFDYVPPNTLVKGFLKPWEAYTGAKINWIDLAQADYNPRLQQSIATKTVDFDIIEMGAPFEGDTAGQGLRNEMPEWVKDQIDYDEYFFNCVSGNSKLMLRGINSTNISVSESYDIFRSLKNLINILSNATTDKDNYTLDALVKKYLPKYLFRQKDGFKLAVTKADLNILIMINNLIQNTELYLRKNDSSFLIIIQRFMLNFSKIIK